MSEFCGRTGFPVRLFAYRTTGGMFMFVVEHWYAPLSIGLILLSFATYTQVQRMRRMFGAGNFDIGQGLFATLASGLLGAVLTLVGLIGLVAKVVRS